MKTIKSLFVLGFLLNVVSSWSQETYPNGQIKSSGNYDSTGLILYHENGQIRSIEFYKEGKLHGQSLQYFPDGTLASSTNYVNGLKEGESFRYYDSTQIWRRDFYVNGVTVGEHVIYYQNGQLQFWRYTVDSSGHYYTKEIHYYQNGQILSTGQKIDFSYADGLYLFYHENGNIMTKCTYNYGKLKNC